MLNSYTIYTDGSDLKHTTKRMGIGGILVNDRGKEIKRFSIELDRDYIFKLYQTRDCSNPFAEMVAVKEALLYFSDYIDEPAEITFKCDYMGVISWINGEWKAKAYYIKQVKEEIISLLEEQKNWVVKFEWIKGHLSIMDKDSYFNNLVDKLAKGKI